MNSKGNSKICIMIVPHTEKVRKLVIPQWMPKALLSIFSAFTIVLLLYIGRNTTYHLSLKQEANNKSSIINDLKEENRKKDLELANLKSQNKQLQNKTVQVENKLVEIDELQRVLEEMAGISSPSKGGETSPNISLKSLDSEMEMDVLTEVLEDKKLELEVFIEDLEAKFSYLKSVPDLMPTSGRLTSKFGNRKNPFGRGIQFHPGIDIANSKGTNIIASAKGTVIFSGRKGGYGKTIIINHGYGYKTLYAHNNDLLVSVGDKVDKGQLIAKMGKTGRSTGHHLHFEIHKNGNPINPFDIIKD
ncbi:M23 family metallopeptidase [Tissierella praeacuta]|uniref:M23 family metallopeptidase n=1 Tax=Tissierella praeacuta TaxID=43131 RepID=UPI0028B0511B|nr:M23 family metallopeptidase [Tissierella praeacuta]